MKKSKDQYYLYKEIPVPGGVDRIYKPILTPDERERRMEHLKETLSRVMSKYPHLIPDGE